MALSGVDVNYPTTHIIYHEGDNNGNSDAKMVDLRTGHHYRVLNQTVTVCSSSEGILLLLHTGESSQNKTYFLYNPSVKMLIKSMPFHPQPYNLHDSSYAVIAVEGSAFDAVFLKRLPYNDDEHYEAVVFSSDTDSIFTMDIGIITRNYRILPNSGVSCGRNVYFLIASNSVLKIDILSREYSRIFMPVDDISTDDTITAQLGRSCGLLGLVIANKSKLWIKVYLRIPSGNRCDWMNFYTVKVELEHACDDVGIIQDEGRGLMRRIRCKEMPRPVRFEGFWLQVPLWVDGRIVMMESVDGNVLLRRIDCQIPPSCVMSYVKTPRRLLYQVIE